MAGTQSSDREWKRTDVGEVWQSYRCPVCGHTDAVSAHDFANIQCSHCKTALEVDIATGNRERVSVHVRRSTPQKPT